MSIDTAVEKLDGLPVQTNWDCIIIGAGPAGSTAAIQIGRKGYRTLLIDKKRFPRSKVCGGCLSGKAVALLNRLQLSNVLEGAIPLDRFVLGVDGRQVSLNSKGGVAISRELLDRRLAAEAMRCGVTFLQGTKATLGGIEEDNRIVHVNKHGNEKQLNAKVVLVCTGLSNPDSQQAVPLIQRVNESSKIGLTSIVSSDIEIPDGTICMSVDANGYLGITRLEDGRINFSACVNQCAIQGENSPATFATRLIKNLGLKPVPELFERKWLGTSKLTRHLTVPAGHRVFVLGDAASYIEPFTGEGIGWAVESSITLQHLIDPAIRNWDHSLALNWDRELSRLLKNRQRTCHAMKFFAGNPKLVSLAIPVLRRVPILSKPIMNAIHGKQQ